MKLIVLFFVFYLANAIPVSKDNNNGRKKAMEHTGKKIGDSEIFQGDMLFKKRVHDYYFGHLGKTSKLADAVRNKDLHWNLPIPYEFDNTIEESRKAAIKASFREYEKKTCIKFRLKNSQDTDYLSFTKADGCWSYIGKNGGKQQVSIGGGCEDLATVSHEIMHALGFFHEQSRPDRDQYIEVKYDNIEEDGKSNFEKQNIETVTTLDHPYDYKSTMHYDKFAFSKNGKATIIRKGGENGEDFGLGYQNEIGLSEIDAGQLKAMYCKGKQGTTKKPNSGAPTTLKPNSGAPTTLKPNTGGITTISTDGSSGTAATSPESTTATTSAWTESTSGTSSPWTEGTSGTSSPWTEGTSGTSSPWTEGTSGTSSTWTDGTSGTTAPTVTTSTTVWEDSSKDEMDYAYDERQMDNDIATIKNLMKDIKKTMEHSNMN